MILIQLFVIGNAQYIVNTTLQLLTERAADYIKWPHREELAIVASRHEFPSTIGTFKFAVCFLHSSSYQFICCLHHSIGMIDTTDIGLKQPLRHLPAYTNRKSVTSVKMQAVCDSTKKFIDVSVGWPGSMHDARIYAMSSISRVINELLEGTEYHILGDSAYRLGIRLLKPYTDYGFLDPVSQSILQVMT